MFDIMNRGNTITATLVIHGVQTTLTSYVQWTANAPYVGNFTGTMNGSPVSIKFSIDMDGTNPVVTSADIPGHPNAVFDVIKETSKNLVECFNGTYSTTKPETRTFNMLLSRTAKIFGGIARKDGTSERNEFGGSIDASNQLLGKDGKVLATLDGDVISGSFKDEDNQTVTVNATRKW